MTGIHFYLTSHNLGYAHVGLNYEQAVQNLELWRLVTAQLSHVEFIHLLFNLSTLWSLGTVEENVGLGVKTGTLYYLQTSLQLLIFSGLVRTFFHSMHAVRPLMNAGCTSPFCKSTLAPVVYALLHKYSDARTFVTFSVANLY